MKYQTLSLLFVSFVLSWTSGTAASSVIAVAAGDKSLLFSSLLPSMLIFKSSLLLLLSTISVALSGSKLVSGFNRRLSWSKSGSIGYFSLTSFSLTWVAFSLIALFTYALFFFSSSVPFLIFIFSSSLFLFTFTFNYSFRLLTSSLARLKLSSLFWYWELDERLACSPPYILW